MALWDMLPDQPLVPVDEETTWGILVEGSLIVEGPTVTSWDHLNAQGGGGTGIILYDGLEVEIDMACYELEIDVPLFEIEIDETEFELEIETQEFELEICDG